MPNPLSTDYISRRYKMGAALPNGIAMCQDRGVHCHAKGRTADEGYDVTLQLIVRLCLQEFQRDSTAIYLRFSSLFEISARDLALNLRFVTTTGAFHRSR